MKQKGKHTFGALNIIPLVGDVARNTRIMANMTTKRGVVIQPTWKLLLHQMKIVMMILSLGWAHSARHLDLDDNYVS